MNSIDPTFFFRQYATPLDAAKAVCDAIPGAEMERGPRKEIEYYGVTFPAELGRLNEFAPGVGPSDLDDDYAEVIEFDVWRTSLAFAYEVDDPSLRPILRDLAVRLTRSAEIRIVANNVDDNPYGDPHEISVDDL